MLWQVGAAAAIGEPSNVTQQFAERALLETMRRTQSGIFVYPVLWLFIGLFKDLGQVHFMFWVINLALFCAIALGRFALKRTFTTLVNTRFGFAQRWFFVLSLLPSFHWGLLTAMSFAATTHYGNLQVPLLLAGCGIVAAGSLAYAILRSLSIAFTACFLLPLLTALLVAPTEDNLFLCVLALVFGVYINLATLRLGGDFWSALRTESLF
jgi:hypothetical protein